MYITTSLLISLFVPTLIVLSALSFSFHSHKDREKLSPYECGFDPFSKARIPFSTRFFLLAVLFLVFDIEIVLLMPTPFLNFNIQSTVGLMVFLLILLLGLLHEWHQGSLDWAN